MSVDEKDFTTLYAAHERDLGRFLLAMLRSVPAAEEALQDVWETAWAKREELEAHADPRGWLFATARHRALRELRRTRSVGRLLVSLGRGHRSIPDCSEAVAVADLLARSLSPQDRALFVLRYAHGFTSRELAAMSGLTAAAVRQRLSRARERLDPPVLALAPNHDAMPTPISEVTCS
jgi:RNA polymerase sigma-70 factor (ECF subfamily)